MSNTVDMTRVEKYFSQLVRADKLSQLDSRSSVEGKMHLISLLGKATKLSSCSSGQVASTRQTELSSGKCISLVKFFVLLNKEPT